MFNKLNLNRCIKGLSALVILFAIALGSYASVQLPKNEKAIGIMTTNHECQIISQAFEGKFLITKSNFNSVAILNEYFSEFNKLRWYVPQKIGVVVNKPIANRKYKDMQKWYLSGNNQSLA